jgi:hypothetical protein
MHRSALSILPRPLPGVGRIALGLALAGMLLSGQRLMAADALSAEERLAAVRQSLLQAALEVPTKVVATSWIDEQGALREMNSFRNGMQVRGVRIVSYERDANGQPNAAVQWDKVADPADKTPPVCPPPSDRFKHLVTLQWDLPANLAADERWMLESLRTLVGDRLRANASAAGQWKLRDRLPEPQGTYARALLGDANPVATWSATVRMTQVPPVVAQAPSKPASDPNAVAVRVPGWFSGSSSPQLYWDSAPRLSVRLELVLQERDVIRPAFVRTLHIDLLSEQVGFGPVQLSEATRIALGPQLSYLADSVGAVLACRAFNPQVTLAEGTQFQIDAGAASGLQVGDEWVLVNGQQIPQRSLDAGVIAQTVLARVSSVSEGSARLQWLAGPQKAVQTQWRAWPSRSLP